MPKDANVTIPIKSFEGAAMSANDAIMRMVEIWASRETSAPGPRAPRGFLCLGSSEYTNSRGRAGHMGPLSTAETYRLRSHGSGIAYTLYGSDIRRDGAREIGWEVDAEKIEHRVRQHVPNVPGTIVALDFEDSVVVEEEGRIGKMRIGTAVGLPADHPHGQSARAEVMRAVNAVKAVVPAATVIWYDIPHFRGRADLRPLACEFASELLGAWSPSAYGMRPSAVAELIRPAPLAYPWVWEIERPPGMGWAEMLVAYRLHGVVPLWWSQFAQFTADDRDALVRLDDRMQPYAEAWQRIVIEGQTE